jgi:cytochrome P450
MLSVVQEIANASPVAAISAAATGWVVYKVLKLYLPKTIPGLFYAPLDETNSSKNRFLQIFAGHLIQELFRDAMGFHPMWFNLAGHKPYCYRLTAFHIVSVGSAEDLYHVLETRVRNFRKNIGYRAVDKIIGPGGLVTMFDEDVHSQHRRAVSRAFAPTALKFIADMTVRDQVAELVKWFREKSTTGAIRIPIGEPVQRSALNVIVKAAFHSDAGSTQTISNDFNCVLNNGAGPGRFIPLYDALFPKQNALLSGARSRLESFLIKTMRALRQQMDQEKAKQPVAPGEEVEHPAIVDYLLHSEFLNEKQILAHSMTFLFAGYETSSTTTQWCLYYLATHPEVQERLFEELSDVVGLEVFCNVDVVKKCKYLQHVVNETLRAMPPVPVVSRVSVEDDVLPSGQFIPKGTFMAPNIYVLHHDPRFWGADADEFRPDRWDDPAITQDFTTKHFMPFSIGSRNCIGKEFAMNEVLLLVSGLVRNLKFSWPADQPKPQRVLQITMRPKQAFDLIVEGRPA